MTKLLTSLTLLSAIAFSTLSFGAPGACPSDDDDPRSAICPGDEDDPKS